MVCQDIFISGKFLDLSGGFKVCLLVCFSIVTTLFLIDTHSFNVKCFHLDITASLNKASKTNMSVKSKLKKELENELSKNITRKSK